MSTVKSIIKKYENHSSVIIIHNKMDKSENNYDLPLATEENQQK